MTEAGPVWTVKAKHPEATAATLGRAKAFSDMQLNGQAVELKGKSVAAQMKEATLKAAHASILNTNGWSSQEAREQGIKT